MQTPWRKRYPLQIGTVINLIWYQTLSLFRELDWNFLSLNVSGALWQLSLPSALSLQILRCGKTCWLIWICTARTILKLQYMEVNVISGFLQGRTTPCVKLRHMRYSPHSPWYPDPFNRMGCARICQFPAWVQKCCSNHYGRDCQRKEGRKERNTKGCSRYQFVP